MQILQKKKYRYTEKGFKEQICFYTNTECIPNLILVRQVGVVGFNFDDWGDLDSIPMTEEELVPTSLMEGNPYKVVSENLIEEENSYRTSDHSLGGGGVSGWGSGGWVAPALLESGTPCSANLRLDDLWIDDRECPGSLVGPIFV